MHWFDLFDPLVGLYLSYILGLFFTEISLRGKLLNGAIDVEGGPWHPKPCHMIW